RKAGCVLDVEIVDRKGLPSHCNSNDLFCPADANAGFEIKKQFPELSSPPDAASLEEQGDAHGRMPSRRRPRARLLRSDRPPFLHDGRDLYARIVLHASGWHAVLEASGAVLGPFPTRASAILFCNARKAHTPAAPVAGERAADSNHVKKIRTRQRQS